MKIKTTCKCGAEFEADAARGFPEEQWRDFVALHATVCMNVRSMDQQEDGTRKYILRRPEDSPVT